MDYAIKYGTKICLRLALFSLNFADFFYIITVGRMTLRSFKKLKQEKVLLCFALSELNSSHQLAVPKMYSQSL